MNISDNLELIFAIVRNIHSKRMNRSMVGYSIIENLKPLTIEDILLFADATGDKNTAYYKDTGIAPPFFLSKLIMRPLKKILLHKDLHLNFLRLVHSGQDITWHREIHTGDRLTCELKIIDISDVPAGELLAISINVKSDKSDIVEGLIYIIIRGRKKTGLKKQEKVQKEKEKLRVIIDTKDGQQVKYAKISGDNNFIHTSNIIAKLAGLPRTIMHGACLMAMTCNALMYLIKNDVKRLKSMSVQFGYPAIPGEKLEVIGYEEKNKKEVSFSVVNSKGKKVLKNGVFRFK